MDALPFKSQGSHLPLAPHLLNLTHLTHSKPHIPRPRPCPCRPHCPCPCPTCLFKMLSPCTNPGQRPRFYILFPFPPFSPSSQCGVEKSGSRKCRRVFKLGLHFAHTGYTSQQDKLCTLCTLYPIQCDIHCVCKL